MFRIESVDDDCGRFDSLGRELFARCGNLYGGARTKPEPEPSPEDIVDLDEDEGYVGLCGGLAFSRSANRHACEQYGPLVDSRSHAKQKSWKQSIVDAVG